MTFTSLREADITSIIVEDRSESGKPTLTTLTDSTAISEVIRFLEERSDGWKAPIYGTPIGKISLGFMSGDRRFNTVSVGSGFMDGQGCGMFVSRNLTASERDALLKLLEITWKGDRP